MWYVFWSRASPLGSPRRPLGRAQLNLDDGLRSNQASSLGWLNGWRLSHLSVQITLESGAGVRRTQVAVRRQEGGQLAGGRRLPGACPAWLGSIRQGAAAAAAAGLRGPRWEAGLSLSLPFCRTRMRQPWTHSLCSGLQAGNTEGRPAWPGMAPGDLV